MTSSVSADIQVTQIRIPARPSMKAGNFDRPGLRLLIINNTSRRLKLLHFIPSGGILLLIFLQSLQLPVRFLSLPYNLYQQ